jgi:hypothetical protein
MFTDEDPDVTVPANAHTMPAVDSSSSPVLRANKEIASMTHISCSTTINSPRLDAIVRLLADYREPSSTDDNLLMITALQWYRAAFRADYDLPDWLAAGFWNPMVAHAAKLAGLTLRDAITATELALVDDYLTWWERPDNPHARYIAGEAGEALELYLREMHPSLIQADDCVRRDRAALAIEALCRGTLTVDFAAWAAATRSRRS